MLRRPARPPKFRSPQSSISSPARRRAQNRPPAGRLTRKAHPWVDSRPSEDQAAFAARGRSDEGLALGLPSLSDPPSVAHSPPSTASVATPDVDVSPPGPTTDARLAVQRGQVPPPPALRYRQSRTPPEPAVCVARVTGAWRPTPRTASHSTKRRSSAVSSLADVGVFVESAAGHDREVLIGDRAQPGGVAGVAVVDVAVDEHEPVASAAAQRKAGSEQAGERSCLGGDSTAVDEAISTSGSRSLAGRRAGPRRGRLSIPKCPLRPIGNGRDWSSPGAGPRADSRTVSTRRCPGGSLLTDVRPARSQTPRERPRGRLC